MVRRYKPRTTSNIIAGGRPRRRNSAIASWADKRTERSLGRTSGRGQKTTHELAWITVGEGTVRNGNRVVQPYLVALVFEHCQLILQTCRSGRGESRSHRRRDHADVAAGSAQGQRLRSQNPHCRKVFFQLQIPKSPNSRSRLAIKRQQEEESDPSEVIKVAPN